MYRATIIFSICTGLISFHANPTCASEKDVIKVTLKKADGGVLLEATNQAHCDLTIAVTLQLTNMKCSKGTKFTINSPSKKKTNLADVKVIDKSKKYRFRYNYLWQWGKYKAKHDDSYNYALPFAPGTAYAVAQGYFGTFSHKKGTENQYSLDFKMPIGTPIHAAREGVVFDTEDNFNEGGRSEKFKEKVNYIKIAHEDGTYASYLHLKRNGVRVKVGQKVKRGQFLGYSGDTGWATMPHLHFDVRRVVNVDTVESIPTAFTTNTRKRNFLRTGFRYGNPD